MGKKRCGTRILQTSFIIVGACACIISLLISSLENSLDRFFKNHEIPAVGNSDKYLSPFHQKCCKWHYAQNQQPKTCVIELSWIALVHYVQSNIAQQSCLTYHDCRCCCFPLLWRLHHLQKKHLFTWIIIVLGIFPFLREVISRL